MVGFYLLFLQSLLLRSLDVYVFPFLCTALVKCGRGRYREEGRCGVMKKIFDFIKNNIGAILGVICVLFICATMFVPLFVAMGHYLWDMAINNPAGLFA